MRALRAAARVHERAAAAAWDLFRPFPLADGAADVVLDVFAPRNPAEFHRVLRPTGRLIVVRPTDRHLAELRDGVPAMVAVDPTGSPSRCWPPPTSLGDHERRLRALTWRDSRAGMFRGVVWLDRL